MENNKIMTDGSGRVYVERRDGTGGKHGYTSNWVKLIVQKKGNFITLQGKKIDVSTLKQAEYTFYTDSYAGTTQTVTMFIVE